MPSNRKASAKRKPSKAKSSRGGRGRSRRGLFGVLGRLFYWCFVLAHLGRHRGGRHRRLLRRQDAGGDDLVDPRPRPQHQDRLGRRPAARQSRHERRRGGRPARNVALHSRGRHRHRGSPLLLAFRHRPDRPVARHGDQSAWRAFLAGRLDADPAAGQEPVPDARPHAGAQGAGGAAGAVAGAQAHQGPDPRNVPQPGLFRLRRLWRRSGLAPLFRQERARRHPVGGSPSRRPA